MFMSHLNRKEKEIKENNAKSSKAKELEPFSKFQNTDRLPRPPFKLQNGTAGARVTYNSSFSQENDTVRVRNARPIYWVSRQSRGDERENNC